MVTAPQRVRHTCRALYRGTGIPADVVRLDDGRWKVVLDAGRVVMTGYFAPKGGQLEWGDSFLEIDGERVLIADGVEHLVQIIANPDVHKSIKVADLHEVLTEIEDVDVEEAPSTIRHGYKMIGSNRVPEGGQIRVGRHGDRWVMALILGDNFMIMSWERINSGDWVPTKDHLRLHMGGESLTVPEQDVEKAIAMILNGGYVEKPRPKAPPIRKSAPAARSNAVETRRATVIRN